ncbi:Oidioi.mRNA.OKI2018_I69.XSR.g14879.t1.cds [Oikopleura dioica]|uniref:Oidioi.mRNA.OKI2018_I69.XSR.g14879.t1.cds n=1 Tax=Oikopleura dioica TaxID=34765 RepID=A0ABN7SB27_OIKDI|nr:Oidioi.mRNA.OKI2018_I69.XSR.g14879.t1.cds [Oikopleura dioica]
MQIENNLQLIERPLNKRGKIDIDMEVSSHDAAKEFPNLLKYMLENILEKEREFNRHEKSIDTASEKTLAVKLDITSIKSLCDRLILDLIEDADLNDALKWLEFSAKNGLDDLAIKCVDGVIADFCQDMMSSSGTDKLSKQAMVQLLRSSTLLVPSEWFVFQMTEKWLLEQEKTSDDILSKRNQTL